MQPFYYETSGRSRSARTFQRDNIDLVASSVDLISASQELLLLRDSWTTAQEIGPLEWKLTWPKRERVDWMVISGEGVDEEGAETF